MSEMEQQPICKIALGIEYDGSNITAGSGKTKCAACRRSWKGALAGGERTDYRLLRRPHRRRRPWHRPVVHFETRAQRKDAARRWGKCEFGDIAVRWSNMYRRIFTPVQRHGAPLSLRHL